jgi:uncharacterized membrane protein
MKDSFFMLHILSAMKGKRHLIPVFSIVCSLLLMVFSATSCSKKENSDNVGCTASFSADIQPVINTKCALSGCHNAGSTLGDFTTYAGVKARADNGRLRRNVFELKIMPPPTAVQLSEHEKEQLKCWLDNGAQKN